MKLIRRAIHLDFHTMPSIPDFGAHFDAEQFARTLSDARVEYVTVFAKCNIGFAYYPTKVGLPHPHLGFDMLGQMVEQCHKQGIAATAYFNVGLDHELARKRRDWTIVNNEGQVIYGDRTANFFRNMCLNSGYRQHMLDMIQEVVDTYPVDGIFLDCMNVRPCHGDECCQAMREQAMDPLDEADVLAFARQNMVDFCRDVKQVVGDEKYLYLNGLGFKETKGLRTHEEIECLPSGWGYDFFPAQAAYARNLGQQVFYMTGRFHRNWGDFGGLKSKASLQNDCWDALSNAVGISIGDHMHPRDGLEPAAYKTIGEIYRDVEALEPWTDHARAVADIAILSPDERISPYHNGAVRMLGELKYTYDIVDETMDFSPYTVLILPDEVTVGPALQAKLEAHLAGGGGIISSGHAGLNPQRTGFALDAWHMRYDGADPWNASYFRMREPSDIPDMPCAIHHQAIQMQLEDGAEAVADYVEPYFNRHWDGFHGYFYTPPNVPNGRPALARSGRVFQFCFNIFTDYAEHAMPAHKEMVKHCLEALLPEPVVRCENMPSTARVTVTEKDRMRMIHVKLTHPETRGRYGIIEDTPVLNGGVVSLKGEDVKSVYLAPTKEPLAHEQTEGYVRIPLPNVEGYAMIVAESQG